MKKLFYISLLTLALLAGSFFLASPKEQEKTVESTKEVANALTAQTPEFVTMIFGGDMMLDRGVKASVIKNLSGDYNKLFEYLAILKDFDIAFANLEGPVSDTGRDKRNLYSFRMDPAILPAMKTAGIDIVSMANNHVGDWQRSAYINSFDQLKKAEILFTGGGMNSAEAEAPTIIEKHGIKIGFLAFSDVGPNDMEVGENSAGLLLAHNPRFSEIIQNASALVDHLVVSFHWGDEYETIHNKRQESLAHKAVDAGAKIIIGHHPHVVQDFEVYKEGYIAYSLGNLIFDQSWSKPTMKGMLLEIKLNKYGDMSVRKNPFTLNKFFQPADITKGKEEEITFK